MERLLGRHRIRRKVFCDHGATSTDHGHPTARTANLSALEVEALFDIVMKGKHTPEQAEFFQAQMLTEMARMSQDDGMVMQIHPGSFQTTHQMFLPVMDPTRVSIFHAEQIMSTICAHF